ncbi:hypothetical protein M8C13_32510 [Crossiella sp. SN42]|uniref:hypothetical protein n=1 Tax=Crossiella sp. SN42 TaxID=2944808 RepID=UPI00207C7165|nr:hypothetical protein [Crossiella sp. SN42]MCO1580487.1 hypothetical protein [Crossiella sp. SN42]
MALTRETAARRDYYQVGLTQFDELHDLRRRLLDHIRSRHPLRTEQLKQQGHPLGAYSDNTTLLAALTQWDAMKDAETRTTAARSLETELRDLRRRNAELEKAAAQHTEQRHRDGQGALDRTRGLREQLDKQTAALTEAENNRRELSCAVVRLCDHITTRGHQLPNLPHPDSWYRQWAESNQPALRVGKPPAVRSRWTAAAKCYQAQWGQQLLQRLWSGSAWTRPQLLGAAPAPRTESLLQALIEHNLVRLHDPEFAALLSTEDNLRNFADDVGAVLGPRKASPATLALTAAADLPEPTGRLLLRIVATAARDHNVMAAQRKPTGLPLLRLRNRQGPAMPARWLLPWLPGQEPSLRELLARARGRDPESGLAVAGTRPPEGADDHGWGPLVQAAGYDPQLVKRLWLDGQPPDRTRVT